MDCHDKYAEIDKRLFSILDFRERQDSTTNQTNKKGSDPSTDADKEKYLSIFSAGGGFKSLNDIVTAVKSLNSVIKQDM